MLFTETPLSGAFLVDPQRFEDERGFFAPTWSVQEATEHGIDALMVESSIAWNASLGTLRGMHFQAEPHAQAKLVRCTQGSIFDVIVDLRTGSTTRYRWFGTELSASTRRMLYVPAGFAHGYLTLDDGSEVAYQMSEAYHPQSAGGIRWDDPVVGIVWPIKPRCLNRRDAEYPLLNPASPGR